MYKSKPTHSLTINQIGHTISVADISTTDITTMDIVITEMTKRKPHPQDMLPLTPAVLHILLALSDGEKHGYAIMQEVETMTDGDLTMGPGTLYGTIKRMLSVDLIEETDERPDPEMDDKRRRYYQVTAFGQQVVAAEARRLSRLVNIAQSKQVFGGAS